jgi:hypothetical protein
MNALRMHTRRLRAMAIARRHPRLFSRLLSLELEPRHPPTQKPTETPCHTLQR